jgi:protein phosphatase 1G
MGAYLSTPVTDKVSEDGVSDKFVFGASSMQGWRKNQEDAHIATPQLPQKADVACFGVFDGHGGAEVSRFVEKYFPGEISRILHEEPDLGKALERGFHRMDELVDDERYGDEIASYKNGAAGGGGRGGARGGRGGGRGGGGRGGGGRGGGSSALVAGGAAGGEGGAGGVPEDEAIEMFKKLMLMKAQMSGARDDAGGGRGRGRGRGAARGRGRGGALGRGLGPGGSDLQVCELDDHRVSAGCTAVCCLVRGNEIVCANAGDSRAVLCRGGQAVPLSFDHKPSQERERARVHAAGGFIREAGGHHRINGNLNLSRSLGDLKYKQNRALPPAEQMITAQPDIISHTIGPEDEFVIVACDGIWDVMSSQAVIDFVRPRLRQKRPVSSIAEELFDHCISDDPKQSSGLGGDNMTAMIVQLKPGAFKPSAAAAAAAAAKAR